jgi:predicted nucleotidyltransferase
MVGLIQPAKPDELRALVAQVADWVALYPIISRVTLFGSRVRGDHQAKSDLDIHIDIDPAKSSFEEFTNGKVRCVFTQLAPPGAVKKSCQQAE